MKYRFYFEEYQNHKNLYRMWWSTEAYGNEYDVPKSTADCLDPATPVEQCEHIIRSEYRGVDMLSIGTGCMTQGGDMNACANVTKIRDEHGGKFLLMYAAPHCHAPACKRMEIWNRDTGELLCGVNAEYGSGQAAIDEESYVVGIPPCIWG